MQSVHKEMQNHWRKEKQNNHKHKVMQKYKTSIKRLCIIATERNKMSIMRCKITIKICKETQNECTEK